MIKAVLFDIDDTLYNSTEQTFHARMNAIKAMIEAGLPLKDEKKCYKILKEIIDQYGSNYDKHFNKLLKKLGVKENYRIISAGIVAYHDTKSAYLKPYHDTIPTLLKLKEMGLKLGVVTEGRMEKQWEKLIRLGIQHFFDTVVISEEVGCDKSSKRIFEVALRRLKCKPNEAIYVGDRLDKDIANANKVGLKTVRILKGKYSKMKIPIKPDFTIKTLSEIIKILKDDYYG